MNHDQHQSSDSKEKKTKTGQTTHMGDSILHAVVAAANQVVLSDQNTITIKPVDTVIKMKAYGFISWDKRRNRNVAARTGGRVEKLFVRYNYQYVKRGQKILNLYAPEINTYAAEYLHHLTTGNDDTLLKLSRQRLQLLGITDQQLESMEKTGGVPANVSIFSPAAGYVVFDRENEPGPGIMNDAAPGDAMGGSMPGKISSDMSYPRTDVAEQLREGMYVNKGETLFKLNDLSAVWGVLAFDDEAQSLLKKNIKVEIKSELLSKPIRSTISLIEPTFNSAKQKFVQVRVYIPNPEQTLKINSLIEGTVEIPLHAQTIIPAKAVFSLGQRRIVWVKTGESSKGKHIFKARDIKVSLLTNEMAVVSANLAKNEEVAADAGFMLDSQSLIEQ